MSNTSLCDSCINIDCNGHGLYCSVAGHELSDDKIECDSYQNADEIIGSYFFGEDE